MIKCCICGAPIESWGNNPWPINTDDDARCCDKCNWEQVIPARILGMADRKTEVDK